MSPVGAGACVAYCVHCMWLWHTICRGARRHVPNHQRLGGVSFATHTPAAGLARGRAGPQHALPPQQYVSMRQQTNNYTVSSRGNGGGSGHGAALYVNTCRAATGTPPTRQPAPQHHQHMQHQHQHLQHPGWRPPSPAAFWHHPQHQQRQHNANTGHATHTSKPTTQLGGSPPTSCTAEPSSVVISSKQPVNATTDGKGWLGAAAATNDASAAKKSCVKTCVLRTKFQTSWADDAEEEEKRGYLVVQPHLQQFLMWRPDPTRPPCHLWGDGPHHAPFPWHPDTYEDKRTTPEDGWGPTCWGQGRRGWGQGRRRHVG